MNDENKTQLAVGRTGILRDPRFLFGVALILVSALVGAWIFRSIASGHDFYMLTKTVPAGNQVKSGDLHLVTVRVPNPKAYVSEKDDLTDKVAKHTLNPGELLTHSALTDVLPDYARIVISPVQPLPGSTQVGDVVQVWALSQKSTATNSDALQSEVLAPDCVIHSLTERGSAVINGGRVQVELAVPRQYLSTLMDALGLKRQLIVIPAVKGH